MLNYELGEMTGIDGSALDYTVRAKTSEYAISISCAIESSPCYKQLNEKLPSPRLRTYFQCIIEKEVYPFILQACVIQWYKRNNKQIPFKESIVLIPRYGVLPEIIKCWDFKEVPIKLIHPFRCPYIYRTILPRELRSYIKKQLYNLQQKFDKTNRYAKLRQQLKDSVIACHYAEGLDNERRNDLNWYMGSGINPERILICFDSFHTISLRSCINKLIKKEVIYDLEKRGFKWIALERNILENQHSVYWRAPEFPANLLLKKNTIHNKQDKWLIKEGNTLLKLVHYWESFYKDFNIAINYIPGEGPAKNIAQAIAFDIQKEKPGFLIGKQRAEMHIKNHYVTIHPKHIFFTWNRRVREYLDLKHGRIDTLIISGYPNDIFKGDKKRVEALKSTGAKFIIALFDNVHGKDFYYSTKNMFEFYKMFLQWLFDDPTIGLIIKSKKPYVIDNLPLIRPLLDKAIETGRCIRIEDEVGRFPSHASFGTDIAVGVGISSALIESVIAGCRGVHYDMTRLKSHEFYRWGYNRIIFNDLHAMLEALKRYKNNSEADLKLGNWSSFMDNLDPFRDGKGGQRMGVYMRWLLEGFDAGKNREEAIQYANSQYAKNWGEDKIIDLKNNEKKF